MKPFKISFDSGVICNNGECHPTLIKINTPVWHLIGDLCPACCPGSNCSPTPVYGGITIKDLDYYPKYISKGKVYMSKDPWEEPTLKMNLRAFPPNLIKFIKKSISVRVTEKLTQ